ncbi:cellulose-binding protein [Micromonospora rosaria]|uniref:Cellulose-binding protein n=1 Tax=Micromonospora rosaria TaxID=47874 RepID=A0A136PT82_9ACTN|nr:cellulose binding domain-containing protein [Micromonospora rosaria]KXK61699.1 cellulose-binding protein [Micromonospora rosaria]
MSRKTFPYAVLAAITTILACTVALPGTPVQSAPHRTAATPVRIMPLGDSITAGPGCWRALLWNQLQTDGHQNIDFVGGASDGGSCNYGFPYDSDHEGHGGFSAVGIADNNQLPPWLSAARPDVVVMHLGTNDLWGGWQSMDTILAAFTKLVGQMRANNPDMKIIVSQIIPHHGCQTCPADTITLNSRIPGWAAGLTTAQSPIVVVDQWTGFNAATDTGDGVHPNDSGFRKIANRFHPALAQLLGGTVPPTSSPSPTPSVTPPPTPSTPPPGNSQCTATYRVVSRWSGGFQGEVSIRNDTTATTTAWTATFRLDSGQQVSQAWNATVTQTGTAVSARNVSWNGGLAPGGSASFGFLASSTGSDPTPVVGCTVG